MYLDINGGEIVPTRRLLVNILRWAAMVGILALTMTAEAGDAGAGTPDVQRVGLPPLLDALQAAANCAGLQIDDRRFRAALASYGLSIDDLTLSGPFAADIAALSEADRTRILDDRAAFCSAARLRFVVDNGILRDALR